MACSARSRIPIFEKPLERLWNDVAHEIICLQKQAPTKGVFCVCPDTYNYHTDQKRFERELVYGLEGVLEVAILLKLTCSVCGTNKSTLERIFVLAQPIREPE